jgi:hypothetical protein
MNTYFLYIFHVKIHFTIVLINMFFLKPQLKMFFKTYFFKWYRIKLNLLIIIYNSINILYENTSFIFLKDFFVL